MLIFLEFFRNVGRGDSFAYVLEWKYSDVTGSLNERRLKSFQKESEWATYSDLVDG